MTSSVNDKTAAAMGLCPGHHDWLLEVYDGEVLRRIESPGLVSGDEVERAVAHPLLLHFHTLTPNASSVPRLPALYEERDY